MSFPYAKDTELKWELIAEERRVRALLGQPELFDRPMAARLVLEMGTRSMELLSKIRLEDHVDTVMLYRHLFEKIQVAQTDAGLLYTTFAIRAMEQLGAERPVIQHMERLRLLLAKQDYGGLAAMLAELQQDQPTTPGN